MNPLIVYLVALTTTVLSLRLIPINFETGKVEDSKLMIFAWLLCVLLATVSWIKATS